MYEDIHGMLTMVKLWDMVCIYIYTYLYVSILGYLCVLGNVGWIWANYNDSLT